MGMAQSVLNWAACSVLESVPGKLGGAWVFRGTRVPYTTVLNNIGDMDVDEIADVVPERPARPDRFVS